MDERLKYLLQKEVQINMVNNENMTRHVCTVNSLELMPKLYII